MSVPHFVGVVRYSNPLLLPTGLYPPIEAPAGVPVWDPFLVSSREIYEQQRQRSRRYGYRFSPDLGVSGYTLSDLTMRFVNFDRQWRHDPPMWRYRGGEIHVELTIAIYAHERARDRPRCLSMIMSHELRHVADEIDIVTSWLPAQGPILLRGRFDTLREQRFDEAIRGRGDGEGSALERAVQLLWVQESSRRAHALHESRPEDSVALTDCLNA